MTSKTPWSTPDEVPTSIGTLRFFDARPDPDTVERLADHLLSARAVEAFLATFPVASVDAIHRGFLAAGINDGDVLIYPELTDGLPLLLTANADTVYAWMFLDLRDGPVAIQAPPDMIGVIDDLAFEWVGDFGTPGPDRGLGGHYLVVPHDYDGPLPDGGFVIYHAKTTHVIIVGRAFLVDGRPEPAAENIKANLRIGPYVPGAYGTSLGSFLSGQAPMRPVGPLPSPRFVDGTKLALDTIPPADPTYLDHINEVVQAQPAGFLAPEIAGQLAAIGIVKGNEFAPADHDREIIEDAARIANAGARVISYRERADAHFAYYNDTQTWLNSLFISGYDFLGPPALVTGQGLKPFPPTGARTLDARTGMFYMATLITPAMAMRVPGIGSAYLVAVADSGGNYLGGANTYSLTLPADIPAAAFWSITVYDNQSRSMLRTPQRYPRAGSQNYPTPAAETADDGTTTIWFAPAPPKDVARGNWVQTLPDRGWFAMLRLYSPTPPFFEKSWKPGDVIRH